MSFIIADPRSMSVMIITINYRGSLSVVQKAIIMMMSYDDYVNLACRHLLQSLYGNHHINSFCMYKHLMWGTRLVS